MGPSSYSTCHLMMAVWPKHVVAITSEEEKKNCCVDGPIIALFQLMLCYMICTVTILRWELKGNRSILELWAWNLSSPEEMLVLWSLHKKISTVLCWGFTYVVTQYFACYFLKEESVRGSDCEAGTHIHACTHSLLAHPSTFCLSI
jgi:hypothetical protein